MSDDHTRIPATGFLRLHQILTIIPVSKSTWWRGCKTGRFPAPVKLGPRITAWRAEAITDLVRCPSWMEALQRIDGGRQ